MTSERSTARGGETAAFDCNLCFDRAEDPVITLCGHLHCWPCIYKWLNLHSQCPVCETLIQQDKLVPLYGRGINASTDHPPLQNAGIPRRPAGLRPETVAAAVARSRRALSNVEGSFDLSPVFSVRFYEFYGGSFGFNYGWIDEEGGDGNYKMVMKIVVLILTFVLFDFMAM